MARVVSGIDFLLFQSLHIEPGDQFIRRGCAAEKLLSSVTDVHLYIDGIIIIMEKVFTDLNILREQPSDVDYFDYKDETGRVKKRIEQAGDNRRNTVIAYLGDYGMGKSQVLNIVHKSLDDKHFTWLSFESWQYSSRQDLWQFFIELTSNKLIGNKVTRWFKKYWLDLIVFIVFIASFYVTFLYQVGSLNLDAWQILYVKYTAGIVLTSIVGYLIAKYIHPKTPLTRIEEFEKMLRKAIQKSKKTIVIVIEDVDRTGDDGVTFMESLSVFLKSNTFRKSVIIIAPQKNTILNPLSPEKGGIRPIENGVKVYDESMYFSVDITARAIETFFNNLSFTKEHQKHKLAMEWITNELRYYNSDQLSIRMLKYALRSVEYFIEANPDYNPAIAFVVILSGLTQTDNKTTAYRGLKRAAQVPGTNRWSPSDINFWQLCMQVAIESTHIDRIDFYNNYIGTNTTGTIKNINQGRVVQVFLNGLDDNNQTLASDDIKITNSNNIHRVDIRIRREYLELVS